jgi:hypothetical protein
MNATKKNMTSQVLPKGILKKNKVALDLVGYYSEVSSIIERTRIAMGKKSAYKVASSSTKNQKLNTNTYGPTY